MKKQAAAVLICCVIAFAVVDLAVSVAIAERPMPHKVSTVADGANPVGGIAASAAGFNYSTGFESTDVPPYLTLGYIAHVDGFFPDGCIIGGFPCWGHTTGVGFSLITPTIADVHPFTGAQHLRLTGDASTRTNAPGFGLGTDARFPRTDHLTVRPIAPNTVSIMVSIDAPFGSDYRIQPQSNSQGFLATSALMYNSGSIYILDDVCGTSPLSFVPNPNGFWDTTGGYQNYTVAMDPCTNVVNYYYGGAPIYASCVFAGTNLEQFLIFSDNFPAPPGFVGRADVDDLVMQSGDGCPCVCGNGIIENPCEMCDPGDVSTGCNPGHTCGAIGTAEECQCSRTCTLDAPCDLANGANGPFYGPFDASFGGIFIYEAPPGVDAVSVELCGSTGIDTFIAYWGSCSDPDDPGSSNDDCCDAADPNCGSFGAGSDPSASCYNNVGAPNYESCTCHDNPVVGDDCYLLRTNGGNSNTATFTIEINKKAVCGQGHLGACCDTNGADAGCTDNVFSGDCVGADKVWTENGKCANVICDCVPDCTGASCGDDGCGGSCGSCDDGNICNGNETCDANRTCDAGSPLVCTDGNGCNGVETCNPATGCLPGTLLNCNDGVACNGLETCNPQSGCVGGTAPNCDDSIECTVDACNEPDGSCSHDDSDCAIPTVSQWGLVVLTIVLLVAAKVQFGRRRLA